MNSKIPKATGIIPARYASSRFPGKPLVDVLGKPMFLRVYERARKCLMLEEVWLATDDKRIEDAAMSYGVPVIMTSTAHQSGSDRVMEAAETLGLDNDSVVVNVQGDEPALEPELINALIAPFADPAVEVTTPARPLAVNEALNPDRVKVVVGECGNALYFSRSPIPFVRDAEEIGDNSPYLLHIGLYAYRLQALKKFTAHAQGKLEKLEKLEQLRFLELGTPIRVVQTEYRSIGIDRPEDLPGIISILRGE